MKIVGISGSLAGYKTFTLVNKVLQAAKAVDSTVEIELIDLKGYDVEFVKGTPLSFYNDDTVKVVNKILSADCLLIGTPIYQASITGALKNLLDHLPVDGLMDKTVGMIAHGETDKHFLILEYHLRSILTFLKAVVPVSNLFVRNDYFDEENEIHDINLNHRIKKLAAETITIQKLMKLKGE